MCRRACTGANCALSQQVELHSQLQYCYIITPPKPLFCSWGPAYIVSGSCCLYVHIRKNDRIYARIYMPHPTPFRYGFTMHFFNLFIYCRLHKGVQDPVSFTVTTGLLDRLGLGLRVRVSIVIIVLGLGLELGSGLGFRVRLWNL